MTKRPPRPGWRRMVGLYKELPGLEMYAEDGAHASPASSDFAAKMIWETIRADMNI